MPTDAARGLFLATLLFAFCGLALLLLAVANRSIVAGLWGLLLLGFAALAAWRIRDHPVSVLLP